MRRLESSVWSRPPRYPLGDAYAGVCHARPGEPFEPPGDRQEAVCNFGYARGRCDCFPADAPDAIRFSIAGDELLYVIEKAYAPLEHGGWALSRTELQLRCNGDTTVWREPKPTLLNAQARVFLENHPVPAFSRIPAET
jgi:hypothetical protein